MTNRPFIALLALVVMPISGLAEPNQSRLYDNRLTLIEKPDPILADYPRFVQPLRETSRFEARPLIDEERGDLTVRCWRFSYNARGIIEMRNRIRGDRTAVIVVHPWGIDDGQGWTSPEPAGVALLCTPEKNQIYRRHVAQVANPFLKEIRQSVSLVMYSLPGKEDPIRKKLYRSFRGKPTAHEREVGRTELVEKLRAFSYRGDDLPAALNVSHETATQDYFQKFPGLDAGPKFNSSGFWELPIPVVKDIDVANDDVLIYDGEGYPALRDFLKKQEIRHVLLAGYNTDMCVCSTTAGYENLRKDFNVFLVGDASMATFPASDSPAAATTAALAKASLNLFITQVSWVKADGKQSNRH
jgi:nicotinamidase-related amidase